MSYRYRVLADSPIGYWRLNEYVSSTYNDANIEYNQHGYGYDQVFWDRLYDETVSANRGFILNGSSAVFADILPLTTSSTNEGNFAGCQVTSTTALGIRNRPNKYKMFFNGTEELSFGMEFWLSLNENPSQEIDILTIYNPDATVAKVYAKNDKIYFTIYTGDTSYTAFKQVIRWDSQIHVLISYTDRKLQVFTNSLGGDSVTLPKTFLFDTPYNSSMDIDYQIGPSPVGVNYVLNDLAFYDYILSQNLIKSHMVWATNDSKPQSYVQQTSGYYIDIKDSNLMFDFYREFSSPEDFRNGISNNIKIDGTGITLDTTVPPLITEGTWEYFIPSSNYSKICGVKIDWDSGYPTGSVTSSSNFVKMEISYDNRATWKEVKTGQPVSKFPDNSSYVYPDLIVRATIYTYDSSQKFLPRIDNLKIGVFNNLNIYSDLNAFLLSPRQGSYTGDTYAIRHNYFNILSRSENFGIRINKVDGSDSCAAIYPQPQSPGFQSIDFWFRYDELGVDEIQCILDSEQSDQSIYFSSDGYVSQNGFLNVFINGINMAEGKTLVKGEAYHFVCVYPAKTNTIILLGGNKYGESYTRATYGFISLYPNALSQTDAQNRYLSYLTSKTDQIGISSNPVGSLAEYSGGSTSFNGGKPILTYTAPL